MSTEIGNNIRKYRKAIGMTQKQLAGETGLAEITIRQYESGKYVPKNDKLLIIAKKLGVAPFDLAPDHYPNDITSGEHPELTDFYRRWYKDVPPNGEKVEIHAHSNGTYKIEYDNADQTTHDLIQAYIPLKPDDRNKVKTYAKDLSLKPEYTDRK